LFHLALKQNPHFYAPNNLSMTDEVNFVQSLFHILFLQFWYYKEPNNGCQNTQTWQTTQASQAAQHDELYLMGAN